jgi:hypothetical protein
MPRFIQQRTLPEKCMARKYSKSASKDVERALHREKKGTLKSGRSGKGGTVKSRKQAIAIGLSAARKAGKKVPARLKRPPKGASPRCQTHVTWGP